MDSTPRPETALQIRNAEALRAIELLLLWEGAVSNERVRELFPVHYTNASRLLSQYSKLNPAGLSYSKRKRRYETDADFTPHLTSGSIDAYLSLRQRHQETTGPSAIVSAHLPLGGVDSHLFSLLHRAISEGLGMEVTHRSMRNPSPASKVIYPHVLVEAGRRWHVRGYVEPAGAFQDLALTRLSDVRLLDQVAPEHAAQACDLDWCTEVPVRLVPHPALSGPQKQIVRAEYFRGSVARIEVVRAAMLPYVIHDLRASIDPLLETPPNYQLMVDRVEELSQWLLPRKPDRVLPG